jgi:hypothetical protein
MDDVRDLRPRAGCLHHQELASIDQQIAYLNMQMRKGAFMSKANGSRIETSQDGSYVGRDYEIGETWRSEESRLDTEDDWKTPGIREHEEFCEEMYQEFLAERGQTRESLMREEARKKRRLIPLWRYFSYAAPKGMVLNPERDGAREHLARNIHKLLWRMLTAALGGFFLSMLAKLVLNIFVGPTTMIEDALFPIAAAFVFWRGLSIDWHKGARDLRSGGARYIPISKPAELPSTQTAVAGHLEHIKALALPNLDSEMESAARSLAKSIKVWSETHDDPVGSQTKREVHLIRTVAEAAREMREKPGLRNSNEARAEMIDVMKSADAHLREQAKKAGASEANDFKSSLRALKAQMGLPSRKK